MQIPKEKIEEFQKLYKEQCGVELDFEEAQEAGEKLVLLVEVICLTPDDKNSHDYK